MKVSIGYIKHVYVEAECPICHEVTGTDCGTMKLQDFKDEIELFCDEHGEFSLPINWGDELNKLIKDHREKQ